MPTGGTGTGQLQDATVQAAIALFGGVVPSGGTGTGQAQDASFQAFLALIISGGGVLPGTSHAITQGQTYAQLATDRFIVFDTSANPQATATLNMIPGVAIGQMITLMWLSYGNLLTQPTIVAPTDTHLVEPFTGMAASGTAGLVATTTISTPGASWTLKWNGTYWLTQ